MLAQWDDDQLVWLDPSHVLVGRSRTRHTRPGVVEIGYLVRTRCALDIADMSRERWRVI